MDSSLSHPFWTMIDWLIAGSLAFEFLKLVGKRIIKHCNNQISIAVDVIKAFTFDAWFFSYRFTAKYVITTSLGKSKIQNALRIPLNSDVNFFSVTVSFDNKNRFNNCYRWWIIFGSICIIGSIRWTVKIIYWSLY